MIRKSLLAGALAVAVVAVACGGSGGEAAQSRAVATPTGATAVQQQSPETAPASAAATAPAKLNLNTATREQLLTVPNAGERMVREFLEYRPYTTIGQFRREIGKYVSQDQVAAYERYLFVPVDPNRADADTLQQLPGVDATIAAQLIAARPYASADAFLAKLSEYVGPAQAAAARSYLATS